MKYSDQKKKMKMAGGGIAEDVKPIEKDLGGLLKAVSPAAMLYDKLGKENRGFMFGLGPGLIMKDRARRKKKEEENIS
tara:strand:- start:212 stop:445 length:234 start_codon:yes stop_codon:yes gene_type:complete